MPDRILLPLIVACALFMENLDSTVLSTALPAIAADFGESPIHLKLALTSYLLAIAVFLPASGWLADRYGARTIFRLAIVLFTARLDPLRPLRLDRRRSSSRASCRGSAAR